MLGTSFAHGLSASNNLLATKTPAPAQAPTARPARLIQYNADHISAKDQPNTQVMKIALPSSLQRAIVKRIQANGIDPRNPNVNIDRYARDMAECVIKAIPPEVAEQLNQARITQPDLIHFSNFPVDHFIPHAATIEERVQLKGRVAESSMLGIGHLLDYQAAPDFHENHGQLINDVAITKQEATAQTGRGAKSIPYHVDMAYTERPPDALLLVGLEGDPDVLTSVVHVGDVVAGVGPEVAKALHKDAYSLKKFPNLALDDAQQSALRFPLLKERDERTGKVRMRWYSDSNKVVCHDEEALAAYTKTQAFISEMTDHDIHLQKGDAILFRNALGRPNEAGGVLHKRKGNISNKHRWLVRSYMNEKPVAKRIEPEGETPLG